MAAYVVKMDYMFWQEFPKYEITHTYVIDRYENCEYFLSVVMQDKTISLLVDGKIYPWQPICKYGFTW